MTLAIELKKTKRTGFFPAFFLGALAASAFPVLNTALRTEIFTLQDLPALDILLNANWELLSMLNSFLTVIGACILYNTEFSSRGMEKMSALPISRQKIFYSKTLLLALGAALMLVMESLALLFCAWYWFPSYESLVFHMAKQAGYSFLFMLPAILLMTLIASFCKNMWVSLGVGVILVFTAETLTASGTALSYFPFALPYKFLLSGSLAEEEIPFLIAAGMEALLFLLLEFFTTKCRRYNS